MWTLIEAISVTFCLAIYWLHPRLWANLFLSRIVIPLPIFSGVRYWTAMNWLLRLQTGLYLLNLKTTRAKAFLASTAMFLFTTSLGDNRWTLVNNLRWTLLTPHPEWISIQPWVTMADYHILTLVIAGVIGGIIVLHHSRQGLWNMKRFTTVWIALYAFAILKVLVAPHPGWTDWGWLTMIHPELQTVTPPWIVLITNDLIPRALQLLSIFAAADIKELPLQ